MEEKSSFWIIIVIVLSFGVTVVCGQNGLLSARCAARCLKEHRDSLRGGTERNNHRNMIDRCKNSPLCFQCIKPCMNEIGEETCANLCRVNETLCESSCHFVMESSTFKPGTCPRPDTAVGFEAVCLTSCSYDGDCSEQTKCCPNECGVTCREPDFTRYYDILPPIPFNLTFEERRKGRSLFIKWNLPRKLRAPRGVVYVLEHRNTTTQRPSWNRNTPWNILLITKSRSVLLRRVHAGHWYQYRVAAAAEAGSQGYSALSKPFKSSRAVQKPLPPQNLTEGATTLRKGQVDVMIHWQPPKYSDLPIWKYTIIWSERLSQISPVIVRIDVLEKTIPGHLTEFKLKNLKPGTTYSIQVEAIIQHHNRHLRSKLASMMMTTYAPPDPEPDNQESVYSVYADVIKVQRLKCSEPYFHQGALKAFLTWRVGKAFVNIVKSYMIYWTPHSCDQYYASLRPLSATSQETSFEVYDLQFECQYVIKVNAVTKKGVQGKPSSTKLRTPVCQNILVKGGSLPPDCPEREPQVPRSPTTVLPKIITNNCTIDIQLSWDQPRSDLPIDMYKIKYGVASIHQSKTRGFQEPGYKDEPIVISLDNIYTNFTLRKLKESEQYVIQIFAHSSAGEGEPAYVEIWTPEILPCGSDKDPVPPGKTWPVTTTTYSPTFPVDGSTVTVGVPSTVSKTAQSINRTDVYTKSSYLNISVPPDKTWPVTTTTFSPTLPVDGSTVTVGVPSTVSKTTQSINRTAVYTKSSKDSSGSSREEIEISIYRTVYYLFFIIYKLLLSS